MLIAAGVDTDALDIAGRSVFHWAALGCSPAMMKELLTVLDFPAPWDEPDGSGYTPLAYAVEHGRIGMVKVLVQAGACTDLELGVHASLLEVAHWYGFDEIAEVLQPGWQESVASAEGEVPFADLAPIDPTQPLWPEDDATAGSGAVAGDDVAAPTTGRAEESMSDGE